MQHKRSVLKGFMILAIVTTSVFLVETWAQCPMCRMSAESNLKAGGTAGQGLNTGILYMLVAPYLLVGTLAFIWWKQKKRSLERNPDQE